MCWLLQSLKNHENRKKLSLLTHILALVVGSAFDLCLSDVKRQIKLKLDILVKIVLQQPFLINPILLPGRLCRSMP